MSESNSFAQEIEINRNALAVPVEVLSLETSSSSLGVRLRGAFITECELTSPTTGNRISVLYSESELEKPKITASHSMVPAGPYDGIGGQHGFPRWADNKLFPLPDDESTGAKAIALQAKRSDSGLSLEKVFVLSEAALATHTTIRNSEKAVTQTSMGEHIYFSLPDENFDGLKVNGKSLDELLGEDSQNIVQNGGTLYWDFGGEAIIEFPAGYSIRLSAEFEGDTKYPLAMWIWKRPGSPSICFEPVAGVKHLDEDNTDGVRLPPYGSAFLSTKVELL